MRQKTVQQITALLIVTLLGLGCSAKRSHNESQTPGELPPQVLPTPVPTPDGSGDSPGSSNSVVFVPETYEIFNTYVAIRPINNPSDIRLTVDLRTDADNRAYGRIKISYMDNGHRHEGVFESGSGENPYLKYAAGNGLKEYHYNYWFQHQGKTVFSGYFQDLYGSVVLIIDDVINQGDGQGGSFVSGSVWFMNFPAVLAPQGPMRKCWFITDGPYNCRTAAVNNKNSLYPGVIMDRSPAVHYHKLGTFSGLSLGQAFK